ncbi:hypothetical protein B9Z19DRAFT_1127730 [Tuber borchii]|uniref:Uncharacterized protein n=1 Tax=Tuber borchii TaxID=42251 RepID=A0A2T6ZQQ6_TUBBO|nr:hypothetical protein B9Z19DRAFT_1127730 [Tuber borchii]
MAHLLDLPLLLSVPKLPDEDFSTVPFCNQMWRDREVKNIRDIVEKPWNVRPVVERDEAPHGWWWGGLANGEKATDVGIERKVKCIAEGER